MLFGIYSDELKIYGHRDTNTQMSLADLLIVTESWKQPRCPSVDDA